MMTASDTVQLPTKAQGTEGQEFDPKIVAFLCRWCSYAGADLAGGSRFKYPPNVRIIRVPCSCRIDPKLIVKSLERGVDGVLVSGCHPGDCHYSSGNYYARRRLLMLSKLLEFLGIDPRRFQMSWVSASEGAKWAQVVAEVTEDIRQLGPARRTDDQCETEAVLSGQAG
jgi:F420-non-reducing hydrogenase iron-sulfur subunit